jgi:hypothetical protein
MVALAIVAVVGALMSLACGGDSSPRGGSKEDLEEFQTGIEAQANVLLQSSLPDGFPPVVEMFPGSEIRIAIESQAAPKSYLVELRVDAAADEVFDFYDRNLVAEGFDARGDFGGLGAESYLWTSAELSVTVSIGADADGNTSVTIATVEGELEP